MITCVSSYTYISSTDLRLFILKSFYGDILETFVKYHELYENKLLGLFYKKPDTSSDKSQKSFVLYFTVLFIVHLFVIDQLEHLVGLINSSQSF